MIRAFFCQNGDRIEGEGGKIDCAQHGGRQTAHNGAYTVPAIP